MDFLSKVPVKSDLLRSVNCNIGVFLGSTPFRLEDRPDGDTQMCLRRP